MGEKQVPQLGRPVGSGENYAALRFRLSPVLLERIRECADRAELSVSAWLRSRCRRAVDVELKRRK